jgi:chaperone modulatory protein CbpM
MIIDVAEFLTRSGIEAQTMELWIERRWLVSLRQGEQPALTDLDAARARFIRDLKDAFGVNDEGVDLVLHLVDQLHGMRQVLGQLRAELEGLKGNGGQGADQQDSGVKARSGG